MCKTVSIIGYGNTSTGVVSRRELTFRSSQRLTDGRFDFGGAQTWRCDNEDLDRLVAFLGTEVDTAGRYKLIDTESPTAAVAQFLVESDVELQVLAAALSQRDDLEQLAVAMTSTTAGFSALERGVLAQRRALVAAVTELVGAAS